MNGRFVPVLAVGCLLSLVSAPLVSAGPPPCLDVSIPATDLVLRIGEPGGPTFQFSNCDTGTVNLLLEAFVDGVSEGSVPIPNWPSGSFVSTSIPVLCDESGTKEVVVVITASRVEDPSCTSSIADTALVTCECVEPCVEVDVPAEDVVARVGENVHSGFQFRNCDDVTLDVVLECFVNGGLVGAVPIPNFLPGSFVSTTIPVLCETPGTYEVVCRLTAWVSGDVDQLCTTVVADTAVVTSVCIEPCLEVDIPAEDMLVDPGENILVPFQFRNCDDVSLDVLLSCFVDGNSVGEVPVPGLNPGSFLSTNIPFICDDDEPGIHEVVCQLAGWLPGDTNRECQVVVADTSLVECRTRAACPRTVGFWRQQCLQRGNGSTKVCLEGMESLWRCVIEATDVVSWKDNHGNDVSTVSLAALSDEDLFDALCEELHGPRPMTLHDMAEIQYLALMLNLCAGALQDYTEYDGVIQTTAGEVRDALENALNTGVDLEFWKDIADNINNRIEVVAEDCPDPEGLFENIPPCDLLAEEASIPATGGFEALAFPNPVVGRATRFHFRIPREAGQTQVEISLFDINGRMVRRLEPGVLSPGEQTVDWDLRDAGGRPVPSGVFFYRVRLGSQVITRKLMVLPR